RPAQTVLGPAWASWDARARRGDREARDAQQLRLHGKRGRELEVHGPRLRPEDPRQRRALLRRQPGEVWAPAAGRPGEGRVAVLQPGAPERRGPVELLHAP